MELTRDSHNQSPKTDKLVMSEKECTEDSCCNAEDSCCGVVHKKDIIQVSKGKKELDGEVAEEGSLIPKGVSFPRHPLRCGCHVQLQSTILKTMQNNSDLRTCQIYMGNSRSYKVRDIERSERAALYDYLTEGTQKLKSFYVHCPLVAYSNVSREDCLSNSDAVVEKILREIRTLPAAAVLHVGKACGCKNALGVVADHINGIDFPSNCYYTHQRQLLLETAAGQGTELGCNWEEIRHLYEALDHKHVGLCADTQHLFASGMSDLRSYEGVVKFFDDVEAIDNNALQLIHLNDSKKQYKSRVDRHENIGEGEIWGEDMKPLKYLLKRAKERDIDIILETPEPNEDLAKLLRK